MGRTKAGVRVRRAVGWQGERGVQGEHIGEEGWRVEGGKRGSLGAYPLLKTNTFC